jgi:hypothetical protein
MVRKWFANGSHMVRKWLGCGQGSGVARPIMSTRPAIRKPYHVWYQAGQAVCPGRQQTEQVINKYTHVCPEHPHVGGVRPTDRPTDDRPTDGPTPEGRPADQPAGRPTGRSVCRFHDFKQIICLRVQQHHGIRTIIAVCGLTALVPQFSFPRTVQSGTHASR